MNKAQARILIANARALQLLLYRDNPNFDGDAKKMLREIAQVFEQLRTDQSELSMALAAFQENLRNAIWSLPTHNHLTTPDPSQMMHGTCNAIVELAKLTDE